MGKKRTLHFNPKPCAECGKIFMPRCGTHKFCDGPHITYCKYCNKEIEYTCTPKEKPNYCSKECIELDKKRKLMEKYGVDNVSKLPSVKKKISEVNSSNDVKEKRKQTCLNKYGVENPFQSEEIKERIKETNLERYGADNVMRNPDIALKVSEALSDPEHIEAHRQHLFEKYGVYDTNDIPGVREKTIQTNMERYGVPYFTLSKEYQNSEANTVISKVNKKHAKILESLGFKVEFEKVIKTKSYDLYIQDKNLLIEIDPTYTHNTFGNHWNNYGIDKNYHINKTNLARKCGYECIHIWDWDSPIKIYSNLLDSNKISSELCELKNIEENELIEFGTKYNLYGNNKPSQYNYGLYYNNECISVMTFGKPRYSKDYEYELIWYCTKFDYSVKNGYEKMLEKFIKDANPKSIVVYCDLSKSSGNIFSQLGFSKIKTIHPIKHWSNTQAQIPDSFLLNETLNEWMIENNWLPVYDCGYDVYIVKSF